jgi:hypothetical protein
LNGMRAISVSSSSSRPFVEPGRSEVEVALAALSPAERLRLFWRSQEIAIARSWALVERSPVQDPRACVEFVIRSRYPEWSDEEVRRLLDAICQREDPEVWLARLERTAAEIRARLSETEP